MQNIELLILLGLCLFGFFISKKLSKISRFSFSPVSFSIKNDTKQLNSKIDLCSDKNVNTYLLESFDVYNQTRLNYIFNFIKNKAQQYDLNSRVKNPLIIPHFYNFIQANANNSTSK